MFLIQYCRLWKFLLKNETRFTAMVSSDQKDKTSHSSFDTDREKADASGTFGNSKGNSESVNLMVTEPFEVHLSMLEFSVTI